MQLHKAAHAESPGFQVLASKLKLDCVNRSPCHNTQVFALLLVKRKKLSQTVEDYLTALIYDEGEYQVADQVLCQEVP